MSEQILADAHNLKKLIREAEALADESMIAFARLKQAMLQARQNPEVEVHAGQRAIMRLNEAEGKALSMSSSLLRVHDELSKLAVIKLGGDDDIPTEIEEAAIPSDPAFTESQFAKA
ncbi:MAG: hypothetical protein AAGK17_12690 [Pseudomonadota bacterium]